MVKPKVVADTNVLISGIIFVNGNSHKILNAWNQGKIRIVASDPLIRELSEVLGRPKLVKRYHLNSSTIDRVVKELAKDLTLVKKRSNIEELRDKKDLFLLELAQAANVDYLITGDKDLLSIKTKSKYRIVSPAEFCKLLG